MGLFRTPLYDRHVEAGARLVPFCGWEMPVQYVGLIQEHTQVRTSIGLFDVSHMGEVFVRGPQALKAVQWLVSNDVGRLGAGNALYTVMCNESGGVVDDLVVYRFAVDEFMLCVNAANRQKDLAWILSNNPFGAEISDESDRWGQIAVQGRHAAEVIQRIAGPKAVAIDTYHFGIHEVSGVDNCMVARTGYTGEDGFEVYAPTSAVGIVWDALMEAGAEFNVMPIGLGARDTLRLEAGYCLYGHELTDETSPWQARLAWVTKMDKPGGFLGREALAKRKGNETHRLVGLAVDGKRIPRDQMGVMADGKKIGWITSGTRSPSLERGIALAYVKRGFTKRGSRLIIDVRGREAEAEVVSGSFFKRDY